MSDRWTKISVIVSIVLIGIPTAASFYPPLFEGLANQLPLDFIFTWMLRFGILSIGILVGYVFRDFRDVDPEPEEESSDDGLPVEDNESSDDSDENILNSIQGCIEVGETCWRGTASLTENGSVSDRYVSYKAICPHCQTVMYDGENKTAAVATTATTYWDCPSCGHTTVEEYSKYENAQNLFQSHIQRIVESEGEEYSLDNLIDSIDGEVTPRAIWEQYAQVMDDDPQVSLNCFH